ncbi:MAG: ATP-binding protein, partial [Terriglobia bacterium]
KELAEISKDFTNPRELIRETIANSIDACASRIVVEALKDDSSGEDELVVRIMDDGVGMTRTELEGFFDLGFSNKRDRDTAIGYKGHGTKVTYNSSTVTVFTKSIDGGPTRKAVLAKARSSLNLAVKQKGDPPAVQFCEIDKSGFPLIDDAASGTVVEVRGYDNNNWNAFAHAPLIDYIRWFTAWGRIHSAWGETLPFTCTLSVRGIGERPAEVVPYGHPFPQEDYDFRDLRAKDERRPENYFVRRWVSDPIKTDGFPDHEFRIAFSVEGDSAKRQHNIMLKRVGRPEKKPYPYESARYTVSDRYGIYVCKDFIPIERKNERFADRSEWTKWHAFINCQSFHLTANRSSVENTPADLLQAIYKSAEDYVVQYVLESDEYEEFARRTQLEAGRRKAEREKKDVVRRYRAYQTKTRFQVRCTGKTLEFREPRSEQGVLWLIGQLVGLWPHHFSSLRVADLDSHFGYDLLVLRKHHLTGAEEPAFVELKHNLRDSADFNHSFDYLSSIVCWETGLHEDEELRDIRDHVRVFKIAMPNNERSFTRYFLNNPEGGLNIEVLVLRKYLEEVLALKPLS